MLPWLPPLIFIFLNVKERGLELIAPKNNIKCGKSGKEGFSGLSCSNILRKSKSNNIQKFEYIQNQRLHFFANAAKRIKY
jgi:hypothetical protein